MTAGACLSSLGVIACLAVATTGARAQAAPPSAACNGRVDLQPRRGSPVARLHPSRVIDRYATTIASREWLAAFGALEQDIDSTLGRLATSGSEPFRRVSRELRGAIDSMLVRLYPVLDLPLSGRARELQLLRIRRFEPVLADTDWEILPAPDGEGILIPRDSMALEEFEAICWASRSFGRLLGGVNDETIPAARARIAALATQWERYRQDGPLQLPHELVLNRLWRGRFGGSSDARYAPPRVDLIALHPFAGIELTRRDGSLSRTESLALETGGFTLWFNDFRQHLGVSWVLAWDTDGQIGRGPLVHVSGYLAAGALWRRDALGKRRGSLVVSIDALRLLNPDDVAQAHRQARGIAGKLLSGGGGP